MSSLSSNLVTTFRISKFAWSTLAAAVLFLFGFSAVSYAQVITGRNVPNPIYGATLDDVGNSALSGEMTSLANLAHVPTARVNFDPGTSASWYLSRVKNLGTVAYIMGQLIDSSEMCQYSRKTAQQRAQQFTNTLGSTVDIWEIGNEINGNWLCKGAANKMKAMYNVVAKKLGKTALTFFYEGEPSDSNNCIGKGNGGNDMFTWINKVFKLSLPPSQRPAETEKIRLGLNYALISWYPQQCPGENPNWPWVFTKLASIFPNAKVGFGELGTAKPQGGSQYEVNLVQTYYPMAKTVSGLPKSYIGGYFWWYYAEEMVPDTTALWTDLDSAIK